MESRTVATRILFALLILLIVAPLAIAQTGDAATNMRTSDFNSATQQDNTSPAQRAFERANGYIGRIQTLEAKRDGGEELSTREEKKLTKAYEKAYEGLSEAIEESPEWVEPRLTLGALRYNRGEFAEALAAFEGVLEVEPEHPAAVDFKRMCDEQLAFETEGEGETGSP